MVYSARAVLPRAHRTVCSAWFATLTDGRLISNKSVGATAGPALSRCRSAARCGLPFTIGLILALALEGLVPRRAAAQFNVGGVYIDGEGMLHETAVVDKPGRVKAARNAARELSDQIDVNVKSALRKVSLARLEKAVAALHADGKPVPVEMRYLAGLESVRYLFLYPAENDVVVAGPAEAWEQLPSGDIVGCMSKHPVLHLDDLATALRFAYSANARQLFLGCSIEPTDSGLLKYQQYMRSVGGAIDATLVDAIGRGMEQALGPQAVRLYGVEPTSRFALKLVASDYRLKRIAMGLDAAPVKRLASYLDLLARQTGSTPQSQHRFWFVGHYDAIRHSPDKLAFEFEGQGVRVQTAPNYRFQNAPAGIKPSKTAVQFADNFTRQFPAAAARVPVLNELKNLVSLALAAVLIEQQTHAETGEALPPGWRPGHLLDAAACPIEQCSPPKQTPTLATVRRTGEGGWMFSVSGGVEINPTELASPDRFKLADDPKLTTREAASRPPPDNDRWWWD